MAHAQHESLKQVTLLFEHATLNAQTWPQTTDNLFDLRSKYNTIGNLLEDTNNQLQVHCLKVVNHKQALQKKNKELVIVKAQLFKQQAKNKHLIAKGVKTERVTKKNETLQFEYNELTQSHFKMYNDLKTLKIDFD